jgi:hypothetical protein
MAPTLERVILRVTTAKSVECNSYLFCRFDHTILGKHRLQWFAHALNELHTVKGPIVGASFAIQSKGRLRRLASLLESSRDNTVHSDETSLLLPSSKWIQVDFTTGSTQSDLLAHKVVCSLGSILPTGHLFNNKSRPTCASCHQLGMVFRGSSTFDRVDDELLM